MEPSLTTLVENFLHTAFRIFTHPGDVHPVVIHFPIVLLSIAPIFIATGWITHKKTKTFFVCAFIFMLLGTAGIFLATFSGDWAAESISPNPEIIPTLTNHVQLAETARLIYSILTTLFLFYLVLWAKFKKAIPQKLNILLGGLFLVAYSFGLLLIYNTAHYGGKLVHHHGIKSSLYAQ